MSQGNFQYSKNLYIRMKKIEFKLNKAEVVDDLDLGSASELIKVRDKLNSMVDELNREIAKVGLEEALMEVKSSVASASDRTIAIGMGLMARGMITKSIRVDEKGNVTAKG